MKKLIPALLGVTLLLAVSSGALGFFDALATGITTAVEWTAELALFLAEQQPELERVYKTYHGDPGTTSGTMTLHLNIAVDGSIPDAWITESTFGNVAFENATAAAAKTWTAPESIRGMELSYLLEYDPSAGIYGIDVTVED
ncbi:MAG: hypothetical protein JSW52_11785 [Candidatus Coatesbacteria bacterium]|nr:MAG: hypothetical protein JSW52_11785 [Candidatus Coatesbacteria bacterium]